MNGKNFSCFIGIDISKSSFYVAIIKDERNASYVFENSKKGTNALIRLLKNQKIPLTDTLMCMEHTGVYGSTNSKMSVAVLDFSTKILGAPKKRARIRTNKVYLSYS